MKNLVLQGCDCGAKQYESCCCEDGPLQANQIDKNFPNQENRVETHLAELSQTEKLEVAIA